MKKVLRVLLELELRHEQFEVTFVMMAENGLETALNEQLCIASYWM